MKTRLFRIAVILIAASLTLMSCKKNGETGPENISATGLKKSHKMGVNCMDCHKPGGYGKGLFTVAGTVYDSSQMSTLPDVLVTLYSEPEGRGTPAGIIFVDGNGNFYTTERIDLSRGVYPSVTGSGGAVKHMHSAVTSGQCNNCHGNSVVRIWAQ